MHHSSTVARNGFFFGGGRVPVEYFQSPMHHSGIEARNENIFFFGDGRVFFSMVVFLHFFSMVFNYRVNNFQSPVRNGAVAKGSHDAVCLRGIRPIGHKWLSLHGFQNYENSNKYVEKK